MERYRKIWIQIIIGSGGSEKGWNIRGANIPPIGEGCAIIEVSSNYEIGRRGKEADSPRYFASRLFRIEAIRNGYKGSARCLFQ